MLGSNYKKTFYDYLKLDRTSIVSSPHYGSMNFTCNANTAMAKVTKYKYK